MHPRRFLIAPTLALALWMIFDGMRCLLTGSYTARELTYEQAKAAKGVVFLVDGHLLEYGLWAKPFELMDQDPAIIAPFFVAFGLLGLFGLVLYYRRKPLGWTILLGFAVCSLGYLIPGTFIAVMLLILLALAPIRRYVFGVSADEAFEQNTALDDSADVV